jgi:hypothetical protein
MNQIGWDEIEIVGFNGAPLVECGRALPVARRNADGAHCVLDLLRPGGELNWYAEGEAKSYADAQRWTLFDNPINLPQSCVAAGEKEAARQPMVVFVDDRLLDTADRVPHPHLWKNEYLIWRHLKGQSSSIQAACASDAAVETLLDDWADGLLKRFDAMFPIDREHQYVCHVADFTLCAARSRTLRWKAYVRYALVQEADRVRRTFDSFTNQEFPDVPWDGFVRELESLRDVLCAQHVPQAAPSLPAVSSSVVTATFKLKDIAAISSPYPVFDGR